MKSDFHNLQNHRRFIRALGVFVPREQRREWVLEWESEIVNRWQRLEKWNRLNMKNRADLSSKVTGAVHDVFWFQRKRLRLLLVTLNVIVALLTGFGATQEFIVRGLGYRQLQPFLLSSVGVAVSVLFIISAVAMLRHWAGMRRLVIATGILSIALHVYGAMPPHRNIGYFALLVGAGYGALMLVVFEINRRQGVAA
jgi:nicotinamide riboside transporter PnuC